MRQVLLFIFLLVTTCCQGQWKRSAHWYFGHGAGINFLSGQPVSDTSGVLNTMEACSVMSDTAGNLLFYTNGLHLYNRQHKLMLNGNNLSGDTSAVRGALIAPHPGDTGKYYVFTVDGAGFSSMGSGFRYTLVDMSLDNGLGGVPAASKSVTLFDKSSEAIAGALHCNKRDYWITARRVMHDTMTFYTYLLDSNGLAAMPLVQSFILDSNLLFADNICYSQDGSLMSYSSVPQYPSAPNRVYLFDFNTETGILSLKDSLRFSEGGLMEFVYATTFSPDNSKLYVSYWQLWNNCYIAQYDLNAANIAGSRVALDSVPIPTGTGYSYGYTGNMQLGPDGRIYVSRWKAPNSIMFHDSIDVINAPDAAGMAAGYQRNVLHLQGRSATWALPNFINSFTLATLPPPDCALSVPGIAKSEFRFYPNPFSDQAVLEINDPDLKGYRIVLNDITGRNMLLVHNPSSGNIIIKRNGLPPGVYVLKVYKKEVLVRTERVIVR